MSDDKTWRRVLTAEAMGGWEGGVGGWGGGMGRGVGVNI